LEKIGIFTSNENDWNVKQLRGEIEKRGIQCICFPITELVARIAGRPRISCRDYDLEEFRALIVRWVPKGSAEQIVFRMDALHRLENLGVRVLNPALAIERCADKFYTCSLLEDAGIPAPKTIVAEKYKDAMKAFLELKDIIVKPLFGSLGAGMLRVSERDLAYRLFTALEFGRKIYFIQEFVPHENRDIRAFVLGDEVIASMKRFGKSWKTNVARGARVQDHELGDELKEICMKAAKVVGCEYAGIDLIERAGEFNVVEVNSIPGWKALQSVAKTNIAENIIDYLLK
jgi:RimK family alpha-L-glutamate ligase